MLIKCIDLFNFLKNQTLRNSYLKYVKLPVNWNQGQPQAKMHAK